MVRETKVIAEPETYRIIETEMPLAMAVDDTGRTLYLNEDICQNLKDWIVDDFLSWRLGERK